MPIEPIKLIPRNLTARKRTDDRLTSIEKLQYVPGNPAASQIDSAVGNCYPGLECDLRNLERRFFPFLEVDFKDTEIMVVSVNLDDASSQDNLPPEHLQRYTRIYNDLKKNRVWRIVRIKGNFGPLGELDLDVSTLQTPSTGVDRHPTDAWTAARLLLGDTTVEITLKCEEPDQTFDLIGNRVEYLAASGALSPIFRAGELSQSLCSPWTHDFRDCGCFYWATNHPDIVQPPVHSNAPKDSSWNQWIPWERRERLVSAPPQPASGQSSRPVEMRHYEINRRWQELNFVIESREIISPYSRKKLATQPFAREFLPTILRYAAGVELAVMQEYLSAAYSIKQFSSPSNELEKNCTAARAQLMRVAYGEMRHIRAVNDVLASLKPGPEFFPALRVATTIPSVGPDHPDRRPVQHRKATKDAIDSFIWIEAPAVSIDSIYSRIYETLVEFGTDEQCQTIRSVLAEGEDHYQKFKFVQHWLEGYSEEDYLINDGNLSVPPPNNPANRTFQDLYEKVLSGLYRGYIGGIPDGAPLINQARNEMVGRLDGAANELSNLGFLVTFETPSGAQFEPLDSPL